ncbi:hypothetical protein AB2B41_03245 [Marimonas sp. MJW-29]|uniref:Cyclic nucleotide-binding domain-containing protein n=1 Tax=Sulfitobacter sediminis TaxID=3234186 RepID=A0ABV3RI22_9RHOB
MQAILQYASSAEAFVHLATVCYVLGLLTRKELVLRVFLLLGTTFYILYYFHITDTPLWDAIVASLLIGTANLIVIFRIFRERSTWGMSEEMLGLYRSFPNFNPGQFRRMMARAEIIRDCPETTLLEEGVAPGKLYLTITDGFVVSRGTQHAGIGPGTFLGEVSFLLGGPATAHVAARRGNSYVVWDTARLARLMDKSPAMANAITVLLSKDVARKLAGSFPVRARSVLPSSLT